MSALRFGMAGLTLGSILFAFLACDRGSPTEPTLTVRFETVLQATVPGFALPEGQREVRDGAAWQAAWSELYGRNAPSPPLPAVDFSREMVVLVTGPGCCGTVEVISIDRRGEELVVNALSRASTDTLCVAPDFSVHAVRLPRLQDSVRFAVTRKSGPCQR